MFENIKLTAHKGSAALVATLVAAALTSVISLATVKLSAVSMSAASATRISTQAEQYAKARAGLIRATKYDELEAASKSSLSGTNFSIEVLKGSESVYDSTNSINQRTMTVNIYNGSDSSPTYSLAVPRYSKELSSGGSGESYVTESWHSGSEGYRVWSDGFIEQWGKFYCGTLNTDIGTDWEDHRRWGSTTLRRPFSSISTSILSSAPQNSFSYSISGNTITAYREVTNYGSYASPPNAFTCNYYLTGY